jgi:hypothetical protein
LNIITFKQSCERLIEEAEDDDECNAYREIVRHIETHRPEKNGLILDLAHMAQDYEQRAGQIRQVAPLSMLVDTLETKARIYKESIQQLGGLRI